MGEDRPHDTSISALQSLHTYRHVVLAPSYRGPRTAGNICTPRTIPDNIMFPKRRLTNPGASGSNADPNRCELIQRLSSSKPFDRSNLTVKRRRVADGAKILLDIAKESSDWFAPLKSALGGVCALIKHYEVLVQLVAAAHN